MSTKSDTTSAALPVPGQFSLRALFMATLISAVVFAILLPIVRRWPTEYQLHFLGVAAACIGFPAALYVFQSWRQRKLERESGKLLAYFPSKLSKVSAVYGVGLYLTGFAIWFWLLNSSANRGDDRPDGWNFIVLGAFLNSGSLWAYGARGLQLRDRGLIFQSMRFDWQQINRFTWPNDCALVLYLASRTVFAIPIPAGARTTIEPVLHAKTTQSTTQPPPDG